MSYHKFVNRVTSPQDKVFYFGNNGPNITILQFVSPRKQSLGGTCI